MNDVELPEIVLDGRGAAPAWLAVAQAAGADAGDPTFYRATAVEFFASGVRFVSCDRYIVLWSWAPCLGYEDEDPPELEESPVRMVVARDVQLRARGLMSHVKALVKEREAAGDDEAVEVALTLGKAESVSWRGMHALELDGLVGEALAIDVPNRERTRIALYEGVEWANWRSVLYGFTPYATHAIALATERVAQLAKLGPLLGGAPIVWRFGGPDRLALVSCGDEGTTVVKGGVMPVRWAYGEQHPPADAGDEPEPDDPGDDVEDNE